MVGKIKKIRIIVNMPNVSMQIPLTKMSIEDIDISIQIPIINRKITSMLGANIIVLRFKLKCPFIETPTKFIHCNYIIKIYKVQYHINLKRFNK